MPQEAAGQWEPIIDEETSRRLKEVLTDPRRRTAPDDLNSKYLLSGIVVCGKCRSKMFAAPVPAQGGGKCMVYRCFGGYCTQRSLEQIDALVQSVVVTPLGMPDAARMFTTEDSTAELRGKAQELRDRRDGLAALLTEGVMSVSVVREQAGKLTRELGDIENAISSAEGLNPAAAVIGCQGRCPSLVSITPGHPAADHQGTPDRNGAARRQRARLRPRAGKNFVEVRAHIMESIQFRDKGESSDSLALN